MKILLDQNMPLLSAPILRDLGHAAEHTFEIGKDRWKDEDLIELAIDSGAVIATRDHDFPELIAIQSLTFPSIILIRNKTFDEKIIADIVQDVCARFEKELLAGCIATADGKSVRPRKLPVKKIPSDMR